MNYSEVLPAGAMWSMRVPRHRMIRLTALDADANVSALFFNAADPLDRLNIPDTLKALHTSKISRGHVLMSDMGRALVSVTADSLGWHDPIGGHSTPQTIRDAFGEGNYQERRNDFLRNARDNFLIELSKHGLGLRDIVANLNFFSKVVADSSGRLRFETPHGREGDFVELRTEMDILAVLANCPHPMHPPGEYPRAAVRLEIGPCEPPGSDDHSRNFRPECARAMELSGRLHL